MQCDGCRMNPKAVQRGTGSMRGSLSLAGKQFTGDLVRTSKSSALERQTEKADNLVGASSKGGIRDCSSTQTQKHTGQGTGKLTLISGWEKKRLIATGNQELGGRRQNSWSRTEGWDDLPWGRQSRWVKYWKVLHSKEQSGKGVSVELVKIYWGRLQGIGYRCAD